MNISLKRTKASKPGYGCLCNLHKTDESTINAYTSYQHNTTTKQKKSQNNFIFQALHVLYNKSAERKKKNAKWQKKVTKANENGVIMYWT